MDEFDQGVACIHEAQELLDCGASRDEIKDCLHDAIDALGSFAKEITNQQSR
jgi:hypothetical protein